jgi:Bacteriophage head to tail connecting protein
MIETSRRNFITGLVSFVAAPAIVRAANIMPVKSVDLPNGILWEVTQDGMVYGRSPMMDVLPSVRELNSMRSSFLVAADEWAKSVLPARYDGWQGFPGR